MARRPARLKDIAAATGFSANTVSLALRGSKRIPDETRDRILAAARKLNYLPNQVAQSLVSRETKTVGLILTSIVNPILAQAARAIERELAERGYSLMLSATRERHRQGNRGAQRLPLAPGRRHADLRHQPRQARPHPAAPQAPATPSSSSSTTRPAASTW